MQQVLSAEFRGACPLVLAALMLFATNALAQSAADNIRPVGQVCLAGQPCVGSAAGRVATESAPAVQPATTSRPATPTPEPVAPTTEPATPTAEPAAATTEPATPTTEPATPTTAPAAAAFDPAATYQQSCFACHATDAVGAPMLGDREEWDARLEKGMDALMANVINGVNTMPAKGLCLNCSDEDLRAVVDYMLEQ